MADVKLMVRTGPLVSVDGIDSYLRAGNEGQGVQSRLHGVHYEAAKRGSVFSINTVPEGLAIPIYSSVTPVGNVLWNPAGSGKNLVMLSTSAMWVSGTAVAAAIVLMARRVVQSSIASGSQITAFAATTPSNGLFGLGIPSVMRVSNAGTCTITAGVAAEAIQTLFGMNAEGAAAGLHGTIQARYDYDGKTIFPPGTLVWLAATLASVALFSTTMEWEEVAI